MNRKLIGEGTNELSCGAGIVVFFRLFDFIAEMLKIIRRCIRGVEYLAIENILPLSVMDLAGVAIG